MKNRSILARMGVQITPVEKPKKVVESVAVQPIILTDPETGDVAETFESFNAAVEAGNNAPNIKKAIKNKTKYKGHLWEYSK